MLIGITILMLLPTHLKNMSGLPYEGFLKPQKGAEKQQKVTRRREKNLLLLFIFKTILQIGWMFTSAGGLLLCDQSHCTGLGQQDAGEEEERKPLYEVVVAVKVKSSESYLMDFTCFLENLHGGGLSFLCGRSIY